MFQFPTTATAPFCPSEVQGTVDIPAGLPEWRKLLRFAGPGLLVAVGYMDPGNWATDIEAGSKFGYDLLFVVLLSSLAAIQLQWLSMRLGIVSRRDLAQLSRDRYPRPVTLGMWVLAELAIIACDVAEVLGSALAFKLLFHIPIPVGVLLTGLDTIIVLGLQGKGFRQVEAIIFGLIATIAICFFVELFISGLDPGKIAAGLVPSLETLKNSEALYLAIGILGATVMPHNLYLHSSIVQTRVVAARGGTPASPKAALRFGTIDIVVSLMAALVVNAAILILAASTFHGTGATQVADIEEAHRLLEPITGAALAGILFGVALLAAGQSSTFTGTIAGQIIMDGFLNLKIPCWQRRVITRGLAIIPAFIGVLMLGDHAVGRMLVFSQVVLSAQLPFAIYPLIRFTGNRGIMGDYANGAAARLVSWGLFGIITAANLWLIVDTVSG